MRYSLFCSTLFIITGVMLFGSVVSVFAAEVPVGDDVVKVPTGAGDLCVSLDGWVDDEPCQCPQGVKTQTCVGSCPGAQCIGGAKRSVYCSCPTDTDIDDTDIDDAADGTQGGQQGGGNQGGGNQGGGNQGGGQRGGGGQGDGQQGGGQQGGGSSVSDDSAYIFKNPLKYDSIGELILALINGITIIIMPIIVLCIAYIGFRMVWAGREKNADYNKWKNAFAWSLAGLFLVLGARGILYVIQNTVKDVLGDEYAEYIGDPAGGG